MTVISFRPNREAENAIARLQEVSGADRTAVIQRALIDSVRRLEDAQFLADVCRLAADPADRAEMAAVLAMMEDEE